MKQEDAPSFCTARYPSVHTNGRNSPPSASQKAKTSKQRAAAAYPRISRDLKELQQANGEQTLVDTSIRSVPTQSTDARIQLKGISARILPSNPTVSLTDIEAYPIQARPPKLRATFILRSLRIELPCLA